MRIATLILLALAAVGCVDRTDEDAPPPIVLIVLDTLRADRLLAYGAERDVAPFLNGLADRGAVFESAWSTAPWTAPATASIFTSLYPFQHGVITGKRRTERDAQGGVVELNRIPPEVETLPELLQRMGYRTFGIADNPNIVEEMGFADGFDRFASYSYEGVEVMNAKLEEWREDIVGPKRPYFLYLHYMEPHAPYHPQADHFEPDDVALGEGIAAGLPAGTPSRSGRDLRTALRLLARQGLGLGRTADLPPRAEEDPLAWVVGAYDSEIGWLDAHLAEVWESLALEDAIVIVTADHGEEFTDHGSIGHGQTTFSEVVRVPLIVRMPGAAPVRIRGNVSHLDLIPTLREVAGAPASGSDGGLSLLPILGGETAPERALHFARDTEGAANDEFGLVLGAHKLRYEERLGNPELYDLERDPWERGDLAAELPELAERLREAVEGLRDRLPRHERSFSQPLERTEEENRRLDELGYGGGAGD